MTADLSCLKNVRLVLETMDSLGYERGKVQLVLNRSNAYTGINVDNAESALGRKIDYEVINEYRGAISALNSGEPFMYSRARWSRCGQSVSKFATELDAKLAVERARLPERRLATPSNPPAKPSVIRAPYAWLRRSPLVSREASRRATGTSIQPRPPPTEGFAMLATALSASIVGVEGVPVRVEVDVAFGLPGLTIVGLAGSAVLEARERVRAALRNSGFEVPARRITINLAPADLPKEGTGHDLAMATGILMASGQLAALTRRGDGADRRARARWRRCARCPVPWRWWLRRTTRAPAT